MSLTVAVTSSTWASCWVWACCFLASSPVMSVCRHPPDREESPALRRKAWANASGIRWGVCIFDDDTLGLVPRHRRRSHCDQESDCFHRHTDAVEIVSRSPARSSSLAGDLVLIWLAERSPRSCALTSETPGGDEEGEVPRDFNGWDEFLGQSRAMKRMHRTTNELIARVLQQVDQEESLEDEQYLFDVIHVRSPKNCS